MEEKIGFLKRGSLPRALLSLFLVLSLVQVPMASFGQTTQAPAPDSKKENPKPKKKTKAQLAHESFVEGNTLSKEDLYQDAPRAPEDWEVDPDAKVVIDELPIADGPPPKVELIVDSSGSMGQLLGTNKTKMYHSKKLLTRYMIDQWREKALLGMRVYGSRERNDCGDNFLSVPFGSRNLESITRSVSMMLPLGRTPIADSIQDAIDDIKTYKGPKRIVLFTDGEETCGGDPCKLAEELKKNKDVDVKIYVVAIGFSPEDESFKKISCIGETSVANSEDDLFSETGEISNKINVRNNLIVKSPNPVAQVNLYVFKNGVREFYKTFTSAWGTRVPPGEYEAEVVLEPFYKFPKFKIPPNRRVILVVDGKGEVNVSFTNSLITAELLDKNMRVVHKFISDQPVLANAGKYKLRISAPPFFSKVISNYIVVPRGKHSYPVTEAGAIQFNHESMLGLHVYNMSDKNIGASVTNAPFVLPTGSYRLFVGKDCFIKNVPIVSKAEVQQISCEDMNKYKDPSESVQKKKVDDEN